MGPSFKTKQKLKIQSNIFKITITFLIWSCKSLDYHRDTDAVRQLTNTAIFIANDYGYIYEKTYLAVHFTNFYQFVNRKIIGVVPKYYLLAGDTS